MHVPAVKVKEYHCASILSRRFRRLLLEETLAGGRDFPSVYVVDDAEDVDVRNIGKNIRYVDLVVNLGRKILIIGCIFL